MYEDSALADIGIRSGCSKRKEEVLQSKGKKVFWVERRACAKASAGKESGILRKPKEALW